MLFFFQLYNKIDSQLRCTEDQIKICDAFLWSCHSFNCKKCLEFRFRSCSSIINNQSKSCIPIVLLFIQYLRTDCGPTTNSRMLLHNIRMMLTPNGNGDLSINIQGDKNKFAFFQTCCDSCCYKNMDSCLGFAWSRQLKCMKASKSRQSRALGVFEILGVHAMCNEISQPSLANGENSDKMCDNSH